jgi:uncharacterized membrane protein YoaK (UPF0700 family)
MATEEKSDLTSPSNNDMTSQRTTKGSKLTQYLNAQLDDGLLTEIELLILAFATGMQDATTFPDYMVFASNQTGNTIFLAVGAAGIAPEAFSFSNIGFALGFFILGGWAMGQLGNTVGPRRRIWILFSSFIQTALVWAAAAVQYALPYRHEGMQAWVVLSLLAFAAGGQVAMARGLKIVEITTAMATAAYVDLLVDPNLYGWNNRGRNRRAAFLSALTLGGFAGAYAHKGVDSAFSVLLSAVLKTVVMIAFALNKGSPMDGLMCAAKTEGVQRV